jgi:arabinan endo-1,5-alpha-L-arabinosidase
VWWLSVLAGALVATTCRVSAQETDLRTHDPSTIIKRGSTYWVFGTGPGIPSFSSPDRVRWTFRGPVHAAPPAWVKDTVPKNTDGFFWAPDVRYVGQKYYLYYSVSSFGSNVSAIGLATSGTLEPGSWEDQGIVIRSEAHNNFNAIDPAIIQSPDGRLWMSFGSFWSGIKMIELHPATGKRLRPDSPIYSLAAHPQERNNAIEAPFIHYRNGYYYLFVNWDYCCRGAKSTYNIRVGRSRRITGPYLDKNGVDLLKGGGTLLLSSKHDDGSGAPFDAKVGPGHAGILTENGVDRFSFHWEYDRNQEGRSVLEIRTVNWDRDGWPRIAQPHLLWQHTDGRASVWRPAQNGDFESGNEFGPFAGWTPQALAVSPADGTARLLWNHTSGTVSLWSLKPDLSFDSGAEFGPFVGWTAVDLSVGGDNQTRLLWRHTDGRASVWVLAPDGRFVTGGEFGPFAGWEPVSLGVGGSDNQTRLLWRHTEGRASLWVLRPDASFERGQELGPFAGWTPVNLAVGTDDRTHLLWRHTDGKASRWTFGSDGSFESGSEHGPFAGWTPEGIGTTGEKPHLLWRHVDGRASVWFLSAPPTVSFESGNEFGPFAGWTLTHVE